MSLPLTKVAGQPSKSDALPGMAHFAGTGPANKTCGDCIFRGYFRHEFDAKKHYGCRKFRNLTGKNGPVVQAGWRSCRHFEQKVRS